MLTDSITPEKLAELAAKDCDRLIAKAGAKKATNVGDSTLPTASGRGPAICLKSGYESFEFAYMAATHALLEQLKKHEAPYQLELDFVVENASGFGDWGRHVWNLYE